MIGVLKHRPVLGWAIYDWANSAFSLSIVTAFLPVVLTGFWNDGAESAVTTARLGFANSIASLLVAVASPVIGAVADGMGRRKRLLAGFAFAGIVMTAAMGVVAQGQWLIGLILYVAASVGYAAGNSLYDSLLPSISSHSDVDQISASGFGLGYLGGALLFAFNVWMISAPETFGLQDAAAAVRVGFFTVALWWAIFSLPVLLWVDEPASDGSQTERAAGPLVNGLARLRATSKELRARRGLVIFLAAYWLYIDGVYTIIKMAADYGLAVGLSVNDVIMALLITNFIGFPAAIAFGYLGRKYGPRKGVYLGLAVYIAATGLAPFIETATQFYALAISVGLVQGGVQSLSRSYYARLVPTGRAGEFFGFYNMLGKFAAILGPALTGVVTLISGSQRIGILSILILFIAGTLLLSRAPRVRP
jgi:UMF1 family MFS transporter